MAAQRFPLLTIGAPQVVPALGAPGGSHQVVVAFRTAPSAGAATLEYLPLGGSVWFPVTQLAGLSITGGRLGARVEGAVGAWRVTFAGLVGGSDPALYVDSQPVPAGLGNGSAAICTQPLVEAAVKQGAMFYVRAAWPNSDPVAAGVPRNLVFTTGALGAAVGLRDFAYIGEEVTLQLFEGPAFTGGTVLAPSNYDQRSANAAQMVVRKQATISANGVAMDAEPEYFFGASAAGQRTQSAIPLGRLRILEPNTSYLVLINSTVGNARVQYYLDWYEGRLDLPL